MKRHKRLRFSATYGHWWMGWWCVLRGLWNMNNGHRDLYTPQDDPWVWCCMTCGRRRTTGAWGT